MSIVGRVNRSKSFVLASPADGSAPSSLASSSVVDPMSTAASGIPPVVTDTDNASSALARASTASLAASCVAVRRRGNVGPFETNLIGIIDARVGVVGVPARASVRDVVAGVIAGVIARAHAPCIAAVVVGNVVFARRTRRRMPTRLVCVSSPLIGVLCVEYVEWGFL
jgi:hypothetical protein